MALLDLVEYLDPTGNVLAARVPPEGSGELRLGSQCIVREGQLAFFARDGRFLDMLIPGRHTLTTANIPLLVEFIKLPFGNKSPFRADVYYVSLQQHTDLKWGTPQPIPMRDSQFGMARIRAFGTYTIQVAEPRKLLTSVVGTRGRKLSVVDLATEYDELSESAHAALKKDFAGLGLELTRFYINTITIPEELEKRLDQVGGVAAMGGIEGYTRFKAAEALEDAAKAGGNNLAGAGVGFGVGVNLGSVMGNALAPSLQPSQAPTAQPQTCPRCHIAVAAG